MMPPGPSAAMRLLLDSGGPEIRFFFPGYLLLYGFLLYGIDYRLVHDYVRRHALWVAGLTVSVFVCLASVWSLTFSQVSPTLPHVLTMW